MPEFIEERVVLSIDEDNILIQLEGLEYLLPEDCENGLQDFEFTQEFVDAVWENVNTALVCKNDNDIEKFPEIAHFWEIWENVFFSAVEKTLFEMQKKSG